MGFQMDTYNITARAFPVYLTVSPITLALISVLPEGFDWTLGGLASFVFLPISYLCGQIGGDLGKKLEIPLWQRWDGPPTTRYLRHENTEFNAITRNKIHDHLRSVGLVIPTFEKQQNNPQESDKYFESCVDYLISQTRDSKRFPLVFMGLKQYGFRRNLLGLKPIGISLTILSILAHLIIPLSLWEPDRSLALVTLTGFLNTGILIAWFCFVTENNVKITAERYARYLLEAVTVLENTHGNSSLPKR